MQLEEFRLLGSFIWKFFHPFENGIGAEHDVVLFAELSEVGHEGFVVGTVDHVAVAEGLDIFLFE